MCPLKAVEILPLTKVVKMPQKAEYTYISSTHIEILNSSTTIIYLIEAVFTATYANFQAPASARFMMQVLSFF